MEIQVVKFYLLNQIDCDYPVCSAKVELKIVFRVLQHFYSINFEHFNETAEFLNNK